MSCSPPPRLSSVRINTLRVSLDEGERELADLMPNFVVRRHERFDDVCVVAASKRPGLDDAILQQRLAEARSSRRAVTCDEHSGIALLRGAHLFARGVLGASADLEVGDRVSVFVDVRRRFKQGAGVNQCFFLFVDVDLIFSQCLTTLNLTSTTKWFSWAVAI